MKNAFITLVLGIGLVSFFSFTNITRGKGTVSLVSDDDDGDFTSADIIAPDTVPSRKTSQKSKTKTVPYDSFGKPKKMDSLQLK